MIKITEQQLHDYIKCPVYYDIKYNSKLSLNEGHTLQTLLGKVAKYFYFHLLNGKICTLSELKTKWDSICGQYPDVIDAKANLEGFAMIHRMLLWAQRENLKLLDFETKYTINTKTVELSGNLPAIIAPREGQYEILAINFSNRIPDAPIVNLKLEHTLGCYGFKCAYNRDPLGVRIHNVKHGRDIKTIRNEDDFKRLRSAIESIGQSIQKGLYYPRELNCHKCAAYDYCRYWNSEESKGE